MSDQEAMDIEAALKAVEVAQQVAQGAQQAAQEAKQVLESAQQAARGVGAETSAATIETEVSPASIGKAWASNNKRTYDEYQELSLTAARRSQTDFDTIRSYAQLALSNAVNNADLLAKQSIAHRDIAIDREWNIDEVAALATVLLAKISADLKEEE